MGKGSGTIASMLFQVATASPEETKRVAATVAEQAEAGDLIVLAGELGAGKTAFVQGFGAALGVTERITSPTFTIAQRYQGDVPIHHLDVYRLEQLDEVTDLALGELLDDGGVVLIEWGDAITAELPPDFLEVSVTFGSGDDDRILGFRPVGDRWCLRHDALKKALEAEAQGGERC